MKVTKSEVRDWFIDGGCPLLDEHIYKECPHPEECGKNKFEKCVNIYCKTLDIKDDK